MKKILVAYFSASGFTEKLAKTIASNTGADLFNIIPEQPYTSTDLDYNNNNCRANCEMNDVNCRPKISNRVNNMKDYDVVYVGYPVWWYEAPRIISTFLDSYDFSNKTIVTFCTSGSSSNNDKNIRKLVKNSTWISGKRLNWNSSQSDITKWVNSLKID